MDGEEIPLFFNVVISVLRATGSCPKSTEHCAYFHKPNSVTPISLLHPTYA